MLDDNLRYKIALTMLPKVGNITAKRLLAYTGSAEAVFKEKILALTKIPGIGEINAKQIFYNKDLALEKADHEIKFIDKNNIKISFFLEDSYPKRLTYCDDAPILLYYKGVVNFNSEKILSIVGTRNATENGKQNTIKLIEDLISFGYKPIIISGLAYGIDSVAHKEALKHNLDTIAVLGHGLQMIYPKIHTKLSDQIQERGAIVTEYSSNDYIDKSNFACRNRIVAGMADATIIVESAAKGGSLITAHLANSYNRDVFAYPGRTTDKYSAGCNNLIKTNKAVLLEKAEDIEYVMNWERSNKKKAIQRKLFQDFTDDEQKIINILKKEEEINIDIISNLLKYPVSKTSTVLLELEFKGVVQSMPGKMFKLI